MRRLLLTASVLLVACGSESEPVDTGVVADAGVVADTGVVEDAGGAEDAAVPDSGEMDAGVAPATWTDVQAILRTSCSPCHDPGNQRRRTVVREYANLVNAMSGQFTLVVPNDPEASFLIAKVTGMSAAYCTERNVGTRTCGGIMPPTMRTPLSEAQVEVIRAWILDGAQDN